MLNAREVRGMKVGDAVFAAYRQVWLAGLGAAVVTRDWAQKEARPLFRSLVRQGTAVESRTIRVVGDRIETSFTRANELWRGARSAVTTTVTKYADTAVTLVKELPRSLPKVELPSMLGAEAPARKPRARRAVKGAPKRAPAAKRPGKRAAKRATKTA